MIQKTTILSKLTGGLLVALVTLVGFQSQAQTFNYSISTDVLYDEDDGFDDTTGQIQAHTTQNTNDSMVRLNNRLSTAYASGADEGKTGNPGDANNFRDDVCYVISGSAAYAIEFTRQTFAIPTIDCRIDGKTVDSSKRIWGEGVTASDASGLVVGIKELIRNVRGLQHVDYERGANQQLVITAHATKTSPEVVAKRIKVGDSVGTLTVNIKVANYDESPISLRSPTNNPQPPLYLTEDQSASILISKFFRDPDGSPVYFNPARTSTDVYVCDSSAPGQMASLGVNPPDNDVNAVPLSDGGIQGTDPVGCSPSNDAIATDYATTNAFVNPGARGTAGNRVISTRKVGPSLHITTDSVVEDLDNDADTAATARPKGTYTARVFFRVWSDSATDTVPPIDKRASTEWESFTVHVKIGANNSPQFAGVSGYKAELDENSDFVAMNDWLAGDLDENAAINNDVLGYGLEGQYWWDTRAIGGPGWWQGVHRAGGFVRAYKGQDEDERPAIVLQHVGVDYETAKSYSVNLYVSDSWSKPVSIPIAVTVKDKNELEYAKKADGKDKKIEDQKLVNGLSREFDLDDYFHDPDEGDVITYSAHTHVYNDIVSIGAGNVLTITGKYATEDADNEVRATITASDGDGEVLSYDFNVMIRHTNEKPKLTDAENGTIAIGRFIEEGDSKGEVIAKVDYTDDDPAPHPMLAGETADMFEAVIGEDDDAGKVLIMVGEADLNHEDYDEHVLTLTLVDAWDETAVSKPLEIHVNVGDVPEPPVASEMDIPDKMIVVHGSGSVDVASFFSDEDEDSDRLIIEAKTSKNAKDIVDVTVEGLDHIVLTGMKMGEAEVSLTARDSDGLESKAKTLKVIVGANNPPVATREIDDMMIQVGSFADVELMGLFEENDEGDMITGVSVMTSDEDLLLVVETNDGDTATLIGKSAGMATVTITAMDQAGNMTDVEVMVTVNDNEAPMLAMAVEDQMLTRLDPAMVDLSETFVDSDGDTLDIMAVSADESIATVEIVDGSLTITGLMVGVAEITLTATDPDGLSAETMFTANVENVAPVVAEAVPDQTTTRVDDLDVDIDGTFADMDGGDIFTYSVAIEDDSIADVVLNGSMINITGKAVGSTIVTLTATDADGTSVSTTFKVTIENIAPVAAGSLSPVALEVGGDSASQSISGLFTDDGDELTYTLALSGTGIANGSLSGMDASFAPVSRGEVTVTITASDPHGGMASVSGTVTVGDGELKSVASKSLAGFGRALISSVSSSVGSRLMNDGRDSDLTLDAWNAGLNDGQNQIANNMDSGQAWNTIDTATTVADTTSTSSYGAGNQSQSGMNTIQSIVGSQFALNLGTSDSPSQWSVWGNVDRQSYEGTGYDGLASSVYLGVDVAASECWLFGVALASNDGESDYTYGTATQTMDMSLTTVLPYVSYQPSDNTTIWGVAGMGSGELDTTVVGAENDMSDLSANIAMVGLKQHLTSAGRLQIDLRGDVAMANIETDEGSNAADGLLAEVNRLRLGVEGSFTSDTGQGGTVTPFGQVNLRSDGGDGDTGTGVEISGGVRMSSSAFTLEARGRTLVMHSADDYSENGFSLMATLNPSQSATGVSVSLAPRWGADAQGMNVLWSDSSNPLQGYDQLVGIYDQSTMSLETQVGYGMLVANERMLLTPFVDVDVSDASRRQLLLGANLSRVSLSNANLAVQFALGRVEERTGETSGKVGLNASISF